MMSSFYLQAYSLLIESEELLQEIQQKKIIGNNNIDNEIKYLQQQQQKFRNNILPQLLHKNIGATNIAYDLYLIWLFYHIDL